MFELGLKLNFCYRGRRRRRIGVLQALFSVVQGAGVCRDSEGEDSKSKTRGKADESQALKTRNETSDKDWGGEGSTRIRVDAQTQLQNERDSQGDASPRLRGGDR